MKQRVCKNDKCGNMFSTSSGVKKFCSSQCKNIFFNRSDFARTFRRKRRSNIKEKFFKMYGDRCANCKESNRIFLTLDHVKNDGFIKRQNHKRRDTNAEYHEAIKRYNPEKYQVLCFNCNCAKHRNKGELVPHTSIAMFYDNFVFDLNTINDGNEIVI